MFKHATAENNSAGKRWINNDLIGLKWKIKNYAQRPLKRKMTFNLVYYISAMISQKPGALSSVTIQHSPCSSLSTLPTLAVCGTRATYEPSNMAALTISSRSAVDRAPARVFGRSWVFPSRTQVFSLSHAFMAHAMNISFFLFHYKRLFV